MSMSSFLASRGISTGRAWCRPLLLAVCLAALVCNLALREGRRPSQSSVVRAWLQARACSVHGDGYVQPEVIDARVQQMAIHPQERPTFDKRIFTDVDAAFAKAREMRRLVFVLETHGELVSGRV